MIYPRNINQLLETVSATYKILVPEPLMIESYRQLMKYCVALYKYEVYAYSYLFIDRCTSIDPYTHIEAPTGKNKSSKGMQFV